MIGTVNISRKIWGSSAFKSAPFSEREAFIWLIMEASWKPRAKRVGDHITKTERGQVAASVRFMASAWDWTPAKVQRYLKRMIKLNLIRSETDTGLTLLTICKYDEYQNKPQAPDTGPIQDRYKRE